MKPSEILREARELLDSGKVADIAEAVLYLGGITDTAQRAMVIYGKANWNIDQAIALADQKEVP